MTKKEFVLLAEARQLIKIALFEATRPTLTRQNKAAIKEATSSVLAMLDGLLKEPK